MTRLIRRLMLEITFFDLEILSSRKIEIGKIYCLELLGNFFYSVLGEENVDFACEECKTVLRFFLSNNKLARG